MHQGLSKNESNFSYLMDYQQAKGRNAETFSWEQPLDRERFCLLTQLLYSKNQQQPVSTESPKTYLADDNPRNIPSDDDDANSNDSIEPRQLASERLDGLKRRFLDRLAEVLAREKKSFLYATEPCRKRRSSSSAKGKSKSEFSQRGSSAGNSHTAAASLIQQNGSATVLVAKNCGLDVTDRSMMDRLSQWIRLIARTGVKPSEKDSFWRKLLFYCRARIVFYITEIYAITRTGNLDKLSTNTALLKTKICKLISLCRELHSCQPEDFEVNFDSMSELATLAYELRSCASLTTLLGGVTSNTKALRLRIALLGRYRGAYETFKEVAMHSHEFKELDIQVVELVATAKPSVDLPFVTKHLGSLNITPKSSGQSAQSLCKSCRLDRSFHAEMQILMQIAKQHWIDGSNQIYPYLGISKKTCFLCAGVLKSFSFYCTRGSHAKVYSLWDIPPMDGLSRQFVFQIRAALLGVQWTVEKLVAEAYHASSINKAALVAESSAGISSETGASSIHRQLRHQEKVKQRLRNDNDNHQHQSKPATEPYGEALRHIVAARLPGDGDSMSLVKVPIVTTPAHYKSSGNFNTTTPSFSDYWGWNDISKSMTSVDVKNQSVKSTNGLYYIYWIEDEDMPRNQYLARLLFVQVAALAAHRRFWCGDVFWVRVHEDKKGDEFDSSANIMFTDISDEFVQAGELIRLLFARYLEMEKLERTAEDTAINDEYDEDRERAKDIILERM